MKQKFISVQIKPLKIGEKAVTVKLPKKTCDYLDSITPKKIWRDYLIEFLQSEKNYDKFYSIVEGGMTEAMPIDVEKNCPKCGVNTEPTDENLGYEIQGNCTAYKSQMWITYFLAANEFVSIVKRNKVIESNKPLLFDLTKKFFGCFGYRKGEGIMYFDLSMLCRHILHSGFLSISQLFAQSSVLKNLSYINNALDEIGQIEIKNKLFEKEDENFISLQRSFFENKQRYYDTELKLKKEGNRTLKTLKKDKSTKTHTIPQLVLYFHYLQAANVYPFFEHHPEGKFKAIEELIIKENIDTTPKYFQIKYNFISNYKSNRIAKNQVANIAYVANKMLSGYPTAKKLALDELSLAQNKHR